jgi:uncharacterized membrane protein YedE/YeeE
MYTLEKLGYISARQHVRGNTTLRSRLGEYDGNMLGGALLGVGMALTGACPGTMIVQLADPNLSGTTQLTLFGALAGAVLHTLLARGLQRHYAHGVGSQSAPPPSPSKRTLSDVTGMSDLMVYLSFAGLIAGIVLSTPITPDATALTTPVVGGLLIGIAQLASLLWTAGPVGVSASYEQAGRYVLNALGFGQIEKPGWPPRAIVFSAGIYAGALALSSCGIMASTAGSTGPLVASLPAWRAILGGIAVVFGARSAGGCTSGHGLSGLAALSLSSLVTVASIFGAGIGTTILLGQL